MQPNHQSSTEKESKNIASRYEPLKQTIHPKQKKSYEMIENNNTNIIQMIVVVLIIAVAALAGMTSLAMPAVVPASAPAEEFSAERAMGHIRAISQEPRPTGSQGHTQARDYIISQLEALGLSPEVQQTTAVMPWGSKIDATIVYNIIARIPGTNSSGAILLDAHYDTMPTTPGAVDCGFCVATLLETARALQAGPPLQNDVILLFTDKEESSYYTSGYTGATAFIEQHPWASEVRQVLNFDGMGRTGPSIMFQTGPHSGWLVREWGRVASQPVVQPWFSEIFRLTGQGTDLSPFADAGIGGLSFFSLFENTIYHTVLDNPESIDPRSVQHHGSNALSMTHLLGNLDLTEAQSPGDVVYFTLVRGLLVSYPATWTIPLVLLAGVLLAGIAVIGFRRRQLTLRGLLRGLSASLLSVIAIPGLATGLWIGIFQLHGAYQSMFTFGRVYNAPLYYWAFLALAVAIATKIHVLFKRKVGATDLAFGALLLWWILAAVFSILMPGFCYLLIWPLLFSTLALGWVLLRESAEANSWRREMVLVAGAVPGLIILTPTIKAMSEYGPMSFLGVTFLFVALLFALLTPQLDLITRARRWRLPGVALLASLGFLIAGSLTAGFDAEHPRPTTMAYLLNADSGQATWFSPGTQLDAWTTQFYGAQPERGTMGELIPIVRRNQYPILHGEAPSVALDAPEVEVLNDQTANGVRVLQLRLRSPRQAPVIYLDVEPRAAVRAVVIDGQRINTPESEGNLWSLTYCAVPPEGIEITLEVESSQSLTLQVSDISMELPDIPGTAFTPRPDDMMPMPDFDYGTVVVRTLEIP